MDYFQYCNQKSFLSAYTESMCSWFGSEAAVFSPDYSKCLMYRARTCNNISTIVISEQTVVVSVIFVLQCCLHPSAKPLLAWLLWLSWLLLCCLRPCVPLLALFPPCYCNPGAKVKAMFPFVWTIKRSWVNMFDKDDTSSDLLKILPGWADLISLKWNMCLAAPRLHLPMDIAGGYGAAGVWVEVAKTKRML